MDVGDGQYVVKAVVYTVEYAIESLPYCAEDKVTRAASAARVLSVCMTGQFTVLFL